MKLSAEPCWRSRGQVNPREPGAVLWDWLVDRGSLTARLRGACGGGFGVRLVSQGLARPEVNEVAALGLAAGASAVVREVVLHCAGVPWVFARSVIPRATLGGGNARLGGLGERPLGELLFADRRTRRGEVEVAVFGPGHRQYAAALAGSRPAGAPLWGRRSLFYLNGRPLLVSEIFLPDSPACAAR